MRSMGDLSSICCRFWTLGTLLGSLGASWASLGVSRVPLGRLLDALGALLDAPGTLLEVSWTLLERFLDAVARKFTKIRFIGPISLAMMLSEDDFS